MVFALRDCFFGGGGHARFLAQTPLQGALPKCALPDLFPGASCAAGGRAQSSAAAAGGEDDYNPDDADEDDGPDLPSKRPWTGDESEHLSK